MERFKVTIFIHGFGYHDFELEANNAPEAVETAKHMAKTEFPWSQSYELSFIYQALKVNGRGQLAQESIKHE